MLKAIMVPLDNTTDSERRIAAAVTAAQKFEAHVLGVHVIPTIEHMMQTIPYMPYSVDILQDQQHILKTTAMALWDNFESSMTHAGLLFDRYQEEGDVQSYLKLYSRCADLTIINQNAGGKFPIVDDMTSFMLESGLPVLAIPEQSAYPTIGKRILVAWKDSAQCGRAVHDALPFLQMADEVIVLSVGEYDRKAVPAADICLHLARHGVTVEAAQGDIGDTPAEVILYAAENMNADLIVAGAWGHSRVTEMIMGGVTKSLLSNQRLPVFFSH